MEIVYVYQRKRREFGRQPLLADRPPDLAVSLPPDPAYGEQHYAERNPMPLDVYAAPDMSEHEVNTESVTMASAGVQHLEGGWPKDVDSSDVEHTLRYRRKVEKDEEYVRQVKALAEELEHCIKQNNAIDIYGAYFADVTSALAAMSREAAAGGAGAGTGGGGAGGASNEAMLATGPPSAKTLNVYRDPNPVKRSATSVSWYPDDGAKIAVAYSVLDFQRTPLGMTYESYIWDVENPNTPDQTLLPSGSPLTCLKYNPKDPHVLVGGCHNGVVAYWDTRKGAIACDAAGMDKAHRDPVASVAWVQSKTGSEFFSTSADGQVLWWDIRKLSEPTEQLVLDAEKNGRVVGGTVLDFETTMPTKFMVGTEAGLITMCNKKAKSPSDRIAHSYAGHLGPVRALQRNPFFTKHFLTVGDWCAKLWSEDVRSPIFATKYHASPVTDGCWSPTRPAVFFTATRAGTVDVWDALFKHTAPTLSIPVGAGAPVTALKVQEHGRMVAAAQRDGSVTLLEVSDALARAQPGEKAAFGAMLEREAKREKTLEAMAREKRLKAAAAKAGGGQGGAGRPASSKPSTHGAAASAGAGAGARPAVPLDELMSADVLAVAEAEFAAVLAEEQGKAAKRAAAAAAASGAAPATAPAAGGGMMAGAAGGGGGEHPGQAP